MLVVCLLLLLVVECVATGPPMGMSPMQRMSHPPGQMQSPLNHTISDLNVSHFTSRLS